MYSEKMRSRYEGDKSSLSTCELCPPGQSSFAGALQCSLCDLGRFSSAAGARRCAACNKTKKREYANQRGSVQCKV